MKKVILRLQELTQQKLFYAWLILRDGDAEQGLLHGTVTPAMAEVLEKLMTNIERKPAFDGEFSDEPRPETRKAEQDTLFKEQP